jgi:ABC-type oligopeptide transport system substrate-binding subunit
VDIPSAQNPYGGNFEGVVDPQVAARDRLGSQTLDADQRAAVYRDLQRDIARQFYFEPVYIDADVTLAKPTLCNFKKWPAPGLNTWNMADWYLARGPTCP